jgi:hypothetical protein
MRLERTHQARAAARVGSNLSPFARGSFPLPGDRIMAIGTSFKQQCPSCEALVTVRDAGMVGKKIECPKCKDKFIVKSPSSKKEADEEDTANRGNGKAAAGKTAPVKTASGRPPAKKPQRLADEDDERDDEDEEETGKRADDEEEDTGKKKKKAASRFSMGIALAVVGLLVLGAAAYFILLRPKGNQPSAKGSGRPAPQAVQSESPPPKEAKEKKDAIKDDSSKPRPTELPLTAATAELTNLLPNDTQHVAHVPFRVLLDPASPLRDAIFQTPGALQDDFLRGKLGFSVLGIDDLIHAERYGVGGWSFTVVHFQEIIDQQAVTKALGLKPAPLVKNHTYYQISSPNPWLEQLARVTVGVPRQLRVLPTQEKRALHVHFHNPQTMIFADEAPMVALLKEDKRFKSLSDGAAPVSAPAAGSSPTKAPADAAPSETPAAQKTTDQPPPKQRPGRPKNRPGKNAPKEAPKEPPMETPADAPKDATDTPTAPPPAPARVEAYVTIKPGLKAVLDRMETLAGDKNKILFTSATDLEAARLPDSSLEDKGKSLWSPREIWDVTLLLHDRNPRLRELGVALVRKDDRLFQLRNELHCPVENDARNLHQELADDVAPDVARFIERLLAHKVDIPKKEEAPAAAPVAPRTAPPGPRTRAPSRGSANEVAKEKDEPPAASKITVTQDDKTVDFVLDLKIEQPEMSKLHGMASLLGYGLRAAMEVAASGVTRHDLATAGKLLPEKGLSDWNLPGQYPPGAFPRRPNPSKRFIREPLQRVSWMAALLPFLGHGQDTLYGKINFNQSWRDPVNWVPASTLVPQFLDPTFQLSTHFLTRPDLPFELAATHFVGIAGVGLDAADYDPADPATITKRGVMGYDKGATLEEVRKGHGLGNTIVMVQVPPDSITGVGPWIAGGGSTLRGVPEKNCVAPFVFSSPGKDGKLRRGTYAIMADGSVRFIDQNVSDEVFKAMATAQSPLPEGYDPDGVDSLTPLVAAPKSPVVPAKK